MKQIYLFIFLIGFATCTYAQFESNKKFKTIPPVNPKTQKKTIPPPTTDFPVIIPPNVYKSPEVQSPPNPVSDYKIDTKSEISMIPKNEFINPGDEVRDRLGKSVDKSLVSSGLKEDDSYLRKKDIDFGVIRTQSPYLIIRIRDYGAIDGDLISATITHDYKEEVLVGRLFLDSNFKEIKIFLKEGFSFLDLEALNKGSLGGNTGEFSIYDDKGKMLVHNYWDNFDTGVKSKFKIIKE